MNPFSNLTSNLMLRGKLISIILLLVLSGILGVSIPLSQIVDKEMHQQVFNKIATVRDNKKSQLEDYFNLINNQITTFSKNKMVIEAAEKFSQAFKALPLEVEASEKGLQSYKGNVSGFLNDQFAVEFKRQTSDSIDMNKLIPESTASLIAQNLYIATNQYPLGEKNKLNNASDGSEYSQVHAMYHPVINDYLKKFGYYDIFLVDPETGYIVYSVFKEVDYATSLRTGPYSDSNIARAFKAATMKGADEAAELVDFEVYSPSYLNPASFIASPIYDGDKLVSVLVFQMPIDKVNKIMENSAGLGETGEAFLVGEDNKMRSQPRFREDNAILSQEFDLGMLKSSGSDKSGHLLGIDYKGAPSLIAFTSLAISGLDWSLVTEIEASEATAVMDYIYDSLAVLLGVSLIVALLSAVVVARNISKPIISAVEVAKNISQGKLDNTIVVNTHDETGQLLESLQEMQCNLKQRIESDRHALIETGRIKQALDSVSGNVIIADAENIIIYLNGAVLETLRNTENDLRTELPKFDVNSLLGSNIDVLYKDPKRQNDILTDLSQPYTEDLQIGGRSIRTTTSPIIDENNQRIGIVVEWVERSVEVGIEQEIQQIVEASMGGDLSQRINLMDKKGFFERLSYGVNSLLDVSDRAINDTVSVLGAMSKGDLTRSISTDYLGAFGELKIYTNTTITKLIDVMSQITTTSGSVLNGSLDIAQGNNNLAQRTKEQAANLEETASAMEEMSKIIQNNAASNDNVIQLAENAQQLSEKGSAVVKEAIISMDEISSSSKEVADIIGVIDEIAFQTNLLALNAAVEAARAGEQGRGFAVVASEVGNLAGRSAEAAKKIKGLINDSVMKVDEGSKLVNKSGQMLGEISASVASVSQVITTITTANKEQYDGIEQVNRAIGQMDQMTQQNAALVEEAAVSTQSMSEQANGLNSLISFFTLTDAANNADPSTQQHASNQPLDDPEDFTSLRKYGH